MGKGGRGGESRRTREEGRGDERGAGRREPSPPPPPSPPPSIPARGEGGGGAWGAGRSTGRAERRGWRKGRMEGEGWGRNDGGREGAGRGIEERESTTRGGRPEGECCGERPAPSAHIPTPRRRGPPYTPARRGRQGGAPAGRASDSWSSPRRGPSSPAPAPAPARDDARAPPLALRLARPSSVARRCSDARASRAAASSRHMGCGAVSPTQAACLRG